MSRPWEADLRGLVVIAWSRFGSPDGVFTNQQDIRKRPFEEVAGPSAPDGAQIRHPSRRISVNGALTANGGVFEIIGHQCRLNCASI
jgi:hypothetical protein